MTRVELFGEVTDISTTDPDISLVVFPPVERLLPRYSSIGYSLVFVKIGNDIRNYRFAIKTSQ